MNGLILSPLWGSLSVIPHCTTGGKKKKKTPCSVAQFQPLHFSPCLPWVKWHGRSVHFDLKECLDHTANTLRELVSSFRPRMLYAIRFMWPGSLTPMFLMSLKMTHKYLVNTGLKRQKKTSSVVVDVNTFSGCFNSFKGKDRSYRWLKGNIKVVPTQKICTNEPNHYCLLFQMGLKWFV